MGIFQYKYKAHKFINYIFYIIVFLIGVGLGFSINKIDLNKLINQILMIDSVKALDIGTIGNYNITDEFIYNQFNNYQEDFLEEYPYVYCNYAYSGNMTPNIECHAFSELYLSRLYVYKTYTAYYQIGRNSGSGSRLYFSINYNGVFTGVKKYSETTSITAFSYWNRTKGSDYVYTNFDRKKVTGSSSSYSLDSIDLDFSQYSVVLEFNENLFKDNNDFKQVCVEEGKSFAITPINGNYSDTGQYTDFIWFPYGLNSGLYKIQYDSSSEYFDGNIIMDTEEVRYNHFYFLNKEVIDGFYDTDLPSDLEKAGYINKYNYFGYDAYKFFIVYKDGLFRYPIFTFDNPSKTTTSSSDIIHGGGGLRLDQDEEIEISSEYCFYIKNQYDVSIVNINEWGDYNGTVSSPDGDYNFNTSYNEFNSNTDSFLSQPIKFINSMKDTITFINSLIYEFYISLPVLLRTFIITVFIILIIMLIMRIGGYN